MITLENINQELNTSLTGQLLTGEFLVIVEQQSIGALIKSKTKIPTLVIENQEKLENLVSHLSKSSTKNPLLILINSKNNNLQIKTEEITKLLFSHKIKFTKLNVANLDYTNEEFIIDNISNKIKALKECYEVIEQINWIGFTID